MWGSVLPLASPSTSWVGWWWGRRGRGSGGGREQEEEEGQKEEEEEEGQAQEAEEQQEEQEEQEKQEKQEQEAPGLPAPSRPARAGGHCADTLPMAAADGCGRWLRPMAVAGGGGVRPGGSNSHSLWFLAPSVPWEGRRARKAPFRSRSLPFLAVLLLMSLAPSLSGAMGRAQDAVLGCVLTALH